MPISHLVCCPPLQRWVPIAPCSKVAWFRVWSPVRVEVARIDRGTITQEAFGRGTIESQREAAVGFDLVGRLSEVLVDEGARVTLGQELARLETDQAQADLRSAQTGIGAARASLQRLAAEEERARALLATAEREADADAGAVRRGGPFRLSSAMRRATASVWRAPSSIAFSLSAFGGDPRHRRRGGRRRAAAGRHGARHAAGALRWARDAPAARARRHGHHRLDRAAHRRHEPRVRQRRGGRDDAAAARRRISPPRSSSRARLRPSRAA
jgi:multidrug resistance efflux pump